MHPSDESEGWPQIIDWEAVGGRPTGPSDSLDTIDDTWASIRDRLRSRDLLRLVTRLVLLVQKENTIAQYSAGFWTLVAWGGGFAASKSTAPKEFYSAGAGAITTLLLALAVTVAWFRLEAPPSPRRWFRERSGRRDLQAHFEALEGLEQRELAASLYDTAKSYLGPWVRAASRWMFRTVYGVLLLTSLIVGELFALLALMEPDPQAAGEPRPVLAAITAGLVGVGLVALLAERKIDS